MYTTPPPSFKSNLKAANKIRLQQQHNNAVTHCNVILIVLQNLISMQRNFLSFSLALSPLPANPVIIIQKKIIAFPISKKVSGLTVARIAIFNQYCTWTDSDFPLPRCNTPPLLYSSPLTTFLSLSLSLSLSLHYHVQTLIVISSGCTTVKLSTSTSIYA